MANNCIICFGDFKVGQMQTIRTLTCLHQFHAATWLTKLLLQPFKELRHKKFLVNVINKAGIAGHFRHAVIIPLREQTGLLIRRFCIHCQQKLTTLVRAKKAILRSSNMVNKVNLPLLNYLSFGKYSLLVLKYEIKRIHCK